MSQAGALAPEPKAWFGQPRGLTVLFLTQMWEQFSYYGMRTLLVYYMTKQLMIGQGRASLIYGFYTAFVYFTPIVGGVVADRWLGRRRSVIIGGLVMAAGHFMMAFQPLFYFALGAIVLGNGLFLPSLPSQINGLYAEGDPRRGSAFNIYYVGINIGGLAAPFVVGTLGETLGWHWGFGAAGVGMVIGLLTYVCGARWLPPDIREARESKPPAPAAAPPGLGGLRPVLLTLAGVWLSAVVFRGAYEQMGNTIALWADQGVDRHLAGGVTIPMTWFQALNPAVVFLLTPLLVSIWTRQAARGREPQPLTKMSLGAAGVALAYLMLVAVAATTGAGGRASWLWLAAFIVLLTMGELFILPIGLGLFGRLAPAGLSATFIAAWFFAAFGGNLFAGALGSLWSRLPRPEYFALMAAVSGFAALMLWALGRFAAHHVKPPQTELPHSAAAV